MNDGMSSSSRFWKPQSFYKVYCQIAALNAVFIFSHLISSDLRFLKCTVRNSECAGQHLKCLRPVFRSRDLSRPIRGRYSGQVISIHQSEASIKLRISGTNLECHSRVKLFIWSILIKVSRSMKRKMSFKSGFSPFLVIWS